MKKLVFVMTVVASVGLIAAPSKGGPRSARAPSARPAARASTQGEMRGRPQGPQQVVKPQRQVVKPQEKRPQAVRKSMPQVRPAPKNHKIGKPPRALQTSHRKFNARGAGGFVAPPHHRGFHANRPHGARFWARPALPPILAGALYAWSWIASPWNYLVDGVYYYGEGYYFDGYNYCYNGGYHLTPPPVVVAQTAVVTQPTVVTQPAVVTPAVVAPAVVTQPAVVVPPPRRRGLLNLLFGD